MIITAPVAAAQELRWR